MRVNFTDKSARTMWVIMGISFIWLLLIYTRDFDRLHRWLDGCMVEVRSPRLKRWLSTPGLRGHDYFIEDQAYGQQKESLEGCGFTGWNLSHFMMHATIGYLCPDKLIESQLLGAGFELLEYMKFNCHDTVDLFANLSGFLFGRMVRRI